MRKFIETISSNSSLSNGNVAIIAPHPDDETFACGGLVAQKRAMNSNVTVIFFTNGEAAHRSCCNAATENIGHVRRQLAIESGKILGLEPENMFWLGLPDGRIPINNDDAFKPAVEKLAELFLTIKPYEIYAPHFLDCWPDHEAANEIVHAALKNYAYPYEIYYYPVWMWHNLRFRTFLKLLKTKAIRLDIGSVLNKKSTAIQHYLSKRVPVCGKPYCGNLPKGFVEHFQYPYEIFFKSENHC